MRSGSCKALLLLCVGLPTNALAVPYVYEEATLSDRPISAQPKPGDLWRMCPVDASSFTDLQSKLNGIPAGNCTYMRLGADLKPVPVSAAETKKLQEREWKAYVACGSWAETCVGLVEDVSSAYRSLAKSLDETLGSKSAAETAKTPAEICATYGKPASYAYTDCMSRNAIIAQSTELTAAQKLALEAEREYERLAREAATECGRFAGACARAASFYKAAADKAQEGARWSQASDLRELSEEFLMRSAAEAKGQTWLPTKEAVLMHQGSTTDEAIAREQAARANIERVTRQLEEDDYDDDQTSQPSYDLNAILMQQMMQNMQQMQSQALSKQQSQRSVPTYQAAPAEPAPQPKGWHPCEEMARPSPDAPTPMCPDY